MLTTGHDIELTRHESYRRYSSYTRQADAYRRLGVSRDVMPLDRLLGGLGRLLLSWGRDLAERHLKVKAHVAVHPGASGRRSAA